MEPRSSYHRLPVEAGSVSRLFGEHSDSIGALPELPLLLFLGQLEQLRKLEVLNKNRVSRRVAVAERIGDRTVEVQAEEEEEA